LASIMTSIQTIQWLYENELHTQCCVREGRRKPETKKKHFKPNIRLTM